jgi:Domain of unknown function (DUF4421)
MFKKIILSFSFLLLVCTSQAGQIDTAYIQKFKTLFMVRGFLLNNGFQYVITPQNNNLFTDKQLNDARTIYSANLPPLTGISLNIKGIGITYIFKFTDDYLDTTSRVKSGYKQFLLNIYGSRFGVEGFYQDYSRFYFHYKGDEILLKNYNPNIRAFQFGGAAIFIHNGKKFSYNAAFNQNQFQKKSTGSSLTVLSLKYNDIRSNNLIPDSVKNYFEYPDLVANRNYAFIFQQGYAYNLVRNNFYFANAVFLGVGLQRQDYETIGFTKSKIGIPISGRVKSSLGYNGKIFFGGIYGNLDYSQSKIKSMNTQQFQYTYGLFIGLRAITLTKSKSQIRQEEKRQKEAAAAARKKIKDDKKQAAKDKKVKRK